MDKILKLLEVFLKVTNNLTLYPYQNRVSLRLIKSVLENKGEEIVILQSRQSGKSEVVADTALFLALIYPMITGKPIRIGIFAPTYPQSHIIFERVKDRFQNDEIVFKDKKITAEISNGNTFKLNNNSVIKCLTASPDANITGETFDVLCLDECQDIGERKIKKDILPMGAATNATKIYIGSAAFHKSFFLQRVQYYEGKSNLFLVHWEEAANDNPRYKKYIESQKIEIGEDSDEFQSQYCLKWILERGMFMTQQKFESLVKDITYIPEKTHYAGIDWGKMNDSTVVTILDSDYNLIDWLELIGDNYSDQLDIIINFLKKYKVYRICCDSSGTQDQILDLFNPRIGHIAEGIKMSATMQNDMWTASLQIINEGRLGIPKSTESTRKVYNKFKHQMLDAEKEYKGGLLSVHSPDDKDDAHDDFVDSLCLAIWCILQHGRSKLVFASIDKPQSQPIPASKQSFK